MPRSDQHQISTTRRDGGAVEAADYIAGSLADLALMARRHGHGTLGYLLDLAMMEAQEIAKQRGQGSPS